MILPPMATLYFRTAGVLLVLLGLFLLACSAAQKASDWAAVKDVTGAVCPLLVQSLLTPAAAPLCIGLSELETVMQELTAAPKALKSGAPGDELYKAILAHRAKAAAVTSP
jgi:predicted Na+-dependent transporter